MPWSTGAGRSVRLTRQPECSPTPTQPIGAFSVRLLTAPKQLRVGLRGKPKWQTVHVPSLLLRTARITNAPHEASYGSDPGRFASQSLFLNITG